ncbi:MAG: hypothetical protein IKH01_09700, partial [Prevotella sp.]|nr:hypothetical protein [Prevotella sp.]
ESAKTARRRLKKRLFAKQVCQEIGIILQQTLAEAKDVFFLMSMKYVGYRISRKKESNYVRTN